MYEAALEHEAAPQRLAGHDPERTVDRSSHIQKHIFRSAQQGGHSDRRPLEGAARPTTGYRHEAELSQGSPQPPGWPAANEGLPDRNDGLRAPIVSIRKSSTPKY